MAEKILNTRIQLKYDTLSEWTKANTLLKQGEIAIAEIPTGSAEATTAPTILMKVGPGNFNSLNWTSALAADVYSWAKQDEAAFTDWVNGIIKHPDIPTSFTISVTATDDDVVILTGEGGANSVTLDAKHAKKGPASGYTGTQAAATVDAFGESMTIKVPKLTVDDYGHTNAAEEIEYTITLPTPEAATNTVTEVAGKDAIKVEDNATNGNHDYEVSLVLDDSGNVELTQSATGLKAAIDLSAYRLIAEDEDTKYGLAYDSDNKVIKLVEGGSDLEIPASDFVADGMLESVVVDAAANTLTFKWNTTAGINETTVKLTDIADIYTAAASATEVQVAISNTNEVSATLVNGGVTKVKLAADVQASLNKADTALQEHQTITTVVSSSGENTAMVTVNGTGIHKIAGSDPIAVTATPDADLITVGLDAAATKTALGLGALATKDSLTATDVGAATADDITSAIEALDSSIVATAEADNQVSVLTGVTQADGKLTDKTEVKLAAIAKTGNVNDLIQTAGDVLVFNCGSATEVI